MLVELGLIAFAYYGIYKPIVAALSGIIEGKIESDIELMGQRQANIDKANELKEHIARTTHVFHDAMPKLTREEILERREKRKLKKKLRKQKQKKPKERIKVEVIEN